MTKTLTNQQIVDIYETIQRMRTAGIEPLPISISFAFIKNAIVLEPLYEAIVTTRNDMAMKHGSRNPDNSITIEPDYIEQVGKDLQELSALTIEIDITPIPLAAINNLSFPFDVIYKLYPLIDDNGEV